MALIAKVVPENLALDREFDYLIPESLRPTLAAGARVRIPFGRSQTTGYVVALAERSDRSDLKSILALCSEKPLVGAGMLKLAQWMADYYGAPLAMALRTVLPGAVRSAGARFRERLTVRLVEGAQDAPEREASCRARKRAPATPLQTPLGSADGAAAGGNAAAEGTGAASAGGRRPAKLSERQERILGLLRERGPLPLQELTAELGVTPAPIRTLAKKGLVTLERATVQRNPLSVRQVLRTEPLALMPAQAAALRQIVPPVGDGPRATLLYGVTGSGKTEVYLQAIAQLLQRGQGAIVLVPEIALTPQTVERFVGRFGDRVAVLHSRLSAGERHDEWHRIREGRAAIVIGARSAVFAPVRKLGLIVVDEEHEPSYKQEEAPRYNARDVAVMRGHMEGCAVVLGSATPSLESWANARAGKYRLARLPERADNRKLPAVRVVDMRQETERTGRANVLSQALVEAVRLRLDRGEQTILFLNRRGFATSLLCPHCGYVANCDQCSVACTYHRSDDRLRCHICGGSRAAPTRCPSCRDPAFRFAGVGTQRVESVVARCFPRARLARMDADATSRKDAHGRILGDFRIGKTDILIGTQMIAKGLHFPNVTLVGVVCADLSLHMPDFRASERTFQLLAQVAGRAGRGEVSGEVIVQTYTPTHAAIQAARRQDFEGFCEQEIESRRELSYPPFTRLMCVTLKGPAEERVAFSAAALARRLRPALAAGVILSEPCPAPLARAKGQYRYQLLLRGRSPSAIMRPVRAALAELKLPDRVAVAVDMDAMSLL